MDNWNWYSILKAYCLGDLTRIDEMAGLNLNLVLYDLSFQHNTNKLQQHLNKQNAK